MTHHDEPLAPRTSRDELLADARRESEGVAAFLVAAEAAFAVSPSAGVEERHMAAILEAARGVGAVAGSPVVVPLVPARPSSTRRWRAIGVIAASFVMTLGLLTGLSYAGVVTLPSPIRAAFGAIGIHLPGPAPASPAQAGEPGGDANASPEARPSALPTTSLPPQAEEPDPSQGGEQSAEARGDRPGKRTGDMPDRKGGDTPSDPADECDLPTLLCGI